MLWIGLNIYFNELNIATNGPAYVHEQISVLYYLFYLCWKTIDVVVPQVAQAYKWLLVCLVFAHDFENKFYFRYT